MPIEQKPPCRTLPLRPPNVRSGDREGMPVEVSAEFEDEVDAVLVHEHQGSWSAYGAIYIICPYLDEMSQFAKLMILKSD